MRIRTTSRGSYYSSQKKSGPSVPWNLLLEMLVLVSLVSFSLFICWHLASKSELFRVSSVQIVGCRHLTQRDVLRLSRVTVQDNLLSLDLRSIAKNIETDPWVRTVEVRRRLPDQLMIRVQERIPVALLKARRLYLVGDRGRIIEAVSRGNYRSFPIITGLRPEDIKDLKQGNPQSIQRALQLISMASKGTRTLGINNISQISVARDGSMLVYTADRRIPFCFDGTGKRLDIQFHRAEEILYQLYRSGMYKRVNRVKLDYAPGCAWASLSR